MEYSVYIYDTLMLGISIKCCYYENSTLVNRSVIAFQIRDTLCRSGFKNKPDNFK